MHVPTKIGDKDDGTCLYIILEPKHPEGCIRHYPMLSLDVLRADRYTQISQAIGDNKFIDLLASFQATPTLFQKG